MECFRIIGDKKIPKKKYNTQEEAIKEAKIINNKPNQIHKVVPYKCKVCFKFHLGKNKTILKHDNNIYKTK